MSNIDKLSCYSIHKTDKAEGWEHCFANDVSLTRTAIDSGFRGELACRTRMWQFWDIFVKSEKFERTVSYRHTNERSGRFALLGRFFFYRP
jgi:hypothetical protein